MGFLQGIWDSVFPFLPLFIVLRQFSISLCSLFKMSVNLVQWKCSRWQNRHRKAQNFGAMAKTSEGAFAFVIWCSTASHAHRFYRSDIFYEIAERCSRIIAKPPSESAVKAWFYNLTNSLQQITTDEGTFPALFPRRKLTLVSNCRNLRSASPSFSKDGCTHTVKSVLRLAKRPNNVTPRISAYEIHFSHAKDAVE